MKWAIVIGVGLGLGLGLGQAQTEKPFEIIYRALESPRCRNCHPAGDAPLQFDDGRPHAMNITRRSEKNGVPCATCHRDKNGTPGRAPVPVPHDELVAAMRAWADAGAPCPP